MIRMSEVHERVYEHSCQITVLSTLITRSVRDSEFTDIECFGLSLLFRHATDGLSELAVQTHQAAIALGEYGKPRTRTESQEDPLAEAIRQRDERDALATARDDHAETAAGVDVYPKVGPVDAAREVAVSALVKEGVPPEEISQALNLRRTALDRILARLAGAPLPAGDPTETEHAATA